MYCLGKANSTSKHDKSTYMYVCSLLERPITLPSTTNQITCMYAVYSNCLLCFQPQQTTYMYVVSWEGQFHFQALQIKLPCLQCAYNAAMCVSSCACAVRKAEMHVRKAEMLCGRHGGMQSFVSIGNLCLESSAWDACHDNLPWSSCITIITTDCGLDVERCATIVVLCVVGHKRVVCVCVTLS